VIIVFAQMFKSGAHSKSRSGTKSVMRLVECKDSVSNKSCQVVFN
jgi:hypothetical protein